MDGEAQTALQSFEDRADAQGSIKEDEVIELGAADLAAFGQALGEGGPTLTAGQKVTFTDDNKLIIMDPQGNVIGTPIALDGEAQTQLQSFEDRADVQASLHQEAFIELGAEDLSSFNLVLAGEGSPALTIGQKVTFTDDNKLVIMDSQGNVTGDPIALDGEAMTSIESYKQLHETNLSLAGIEKVEHVHPAPGGAASKLVFVLGQDKTGTDVNNVYFGGTKNLVVKGNDADNIIKGNNGDNTIFGGSGNDVLLGYGGNDVIKGGSGDDFADGMEGQDRVYGQRGNDTLIATGHIDGESDGEASDLLAGGSGSDTLIDAANKTTGRTDLLGGSGEDTFAIGVMQHDLTFGEGAPVETWELADRGVNTHIADLTTSDDLDFIDLKDEITVAEAPLLEAMDMDGDGIDPATSRISMNLDVAEIDLTGGKAVGVSIEADDLIPLNPSTGQPAFGEGDTITEEIREILINHAEIDPTNTTIAVGLSVTVDHILQITEDAPVLDLSGKIGISHATENSIIAAMEGEGSSSTDIAFGAAGSGDAMDHYGITEDLVWVADI